MTLDQIEMIEAIVQEGSYQAAAKKLHKSQPSLTTGVKKVEELYGIQIFSRAGYRPTLTDIGRRFYETAKETLQSFRQLDKLATELGTGHEPSITISVDPIVLATRFAPMLETVFSQDYQTQINLRSGVLFDNAKALTTNEADIAIGTYPLIDNENIEQIKICAVELVPVIHKKHLRHSDLSAQLLQSLPNIIVNTKRDGESNVTQNAHIKWNVDSHIRKSELIIMGMGWGRLSSLQIKPLQNLVQIPESLIERVNVDIYLMRNKLKPVGPIARKLWESMLD